MLPRWAGSSTVELASRMSVVRVSPLPLEGVAEAIPLASPWCSIKPQSFPRRRESKLFKGMGSRLRGNDGMVLGQRFLQSRVSIAPARGDGTS